MRGSSIAKLQKRRGNHKDYLGEVAQTGLGGGWWIDRSRMVGLRPLSGLSGSHLSAIVWKRAESASYIKSLPASPSPMPSTSLITSTACSVPSTPATGPSTPASSQLATVPAAAPRGIGSGSSAAAARLVRLVGAEGGEIAVELAERREYQRFFGEIAGIVDEVAGGEIVGAVSHDVVAGDDFEGVLSGEPEGHGLGHNVRIEGPAEGGGALGLAARRHPRWCKATWRCRLSIDTRSSSMMPMAPTPAAARYMMSGDPSPPAPTTSTRAAFSRCCPARRPPSKAGAACIAGFRRVRAPASPFDSDLVPI